jgi:hypothetical protein
MAVKRPTPKPSQKSVNYQHKLLFSRHWALGQPLRPTDNIFASAGAASTLARSTLFTAAALGLLSIRISRTATHRSTRRSSTRQFATQPMFSMGCFTTNLTCESKNTTQIRQGLLTMCSVFAICWDSALRRAFAILPIGG